MKKRLYVGNLDYSITSKQLEELFSQAGTVEDAEVVMYARSERSKGFGFVTMSSEEEAEKAKEMFNEKEVEGRPVIVDEARPRPETEEEETTAAAVEEVEVEPAVETAEEEAEEPADAEEDVEEIEVEEAEPEEE